MTERLPLSDRLLVLLLTATLGLALAAGATWLVLSQHRDFLAIARSDSEDALGFLAYVTQRELQNGHYEGLTELFERWAGEQAGVDAVRLTARNGFVIADYRRDATTRRQLRLEQSVAYGYAGAARLSLTRDLDGVYARTRQYTWTVGGIAAMLTLLFGLITHLYLARRREAARLSLRGAELAESNRRLQLAVSGLEQSQVDNRRLAAFPRENPNPIVAFDQDGAALFENPAFRRLLGELRSDRPDSALPPDHPALLWQAFSGASGGTREYGVGQRYFQAEYHHPGHSGEVFVYLRELTDQRQAEIRLRHEQSRALVTLASIGDAVVTTDSLGQVEYLNAAAETLCGMEAKSAVGRQLAQILTLVYDDSNEPIGDIGARCAKRQVVLELEDRVSLLRPDGRLVPVQGTAAPIHLDANVVRGVVVVLRDVSHERDLQAELTQRATHDNLTGLLNRYAFETHLEQALESARARDREHALCFIDLDQFKVVNDTCGHTAGDELLRQLATAMRQHVREGDDVLARLGGDEFAVLLHDCPVAQALQRAERLRVALGEYSFSWDNHIFRTGASIGVTPITRASSTVGEVLSAADLACYEAKDLGRNRVNLLNPSDTSNPLQHREMHWVSRINAALAQDRLVLYGQPIVDLNVEGGAPWGIEVLVRMIAEDGSLIPPGAFLPAAERFDLIQHIDHWVIGRALALLSSSTEPPPLCFINISGPTLGDATLAGFLREQLAHHAVDPSTLVFEVTETAAIRNLGSALELIRELKALGLRFALDDFGTGVSSFAYLKNLPVDFIKIDGSFVRDLGRDAMDRALVEAIHKVSETLGLQTIAEFIESHEVLGVVRDLGIARGQGFGIATPQPLTELLHPPQRTPVRRRREG